MDAEKRDMYRHTKGRKNWRRRWFTPSYWSRRGPTSESRRIHSFLEHLKWEREGEKDVSRQRARLKVRNGSMRVRIIVFEELFSITKESFAHFLRHCWTTTTQPFCSREGWVIGKEGGRKDMFDTRRGREWNGRSKVRDGDRRCMQDIYSCEGVMMLFIWKGRVTWCTFSWSENVLICMRWLQVTETARWWLFLTYSMKAEEVLWGFNKWRKERRICRQIRCMRDPLTRNKFEKWFKRIADNSERSNLSIKCKHEEHKYLTFPFYPPSSPPPSCSFLIFTTQIIHWMHG